MANLLSKSGRQLDFDVIAENFNLRLVAVRLYFSDANPQFLTLFTGFSQAEVAERLQAQLIELEHDACLTLLAAIEAAFRLDYMQRNERRLKRSSSLINRGLRDLYQKHQSRASLEEGILQAWFNAAPEYEALISALRGAFKYRHWLAHGRYWNPKLGRKYDFDTIFALATAVSDLNLVV